MIIRLLIFGIVIFLVFRLLRTLISPSSPSRSPFQPHGRKMVVDDMVRDPYCGVYISKKDAYSVRIGDKVIPFCSEECYRKYLQGDTPPQDQ
ncbi:MAG: hypothetical protein JXD19_10825 [Deltaproteobacteria bacterium]|nr:hypothetical protein [Deltaproteobacteria bacterium]